MTFIVDTNVILVANGQHGGVEENCVTCCTSWLRRIMTGERFAIDDAFEILSEYQNKTSPWTGNRPGDAFLKWVLQNKATERCDQISITPNTGKGFDEFPDDARLENFDPPDRKFVAVSAAHPEHPPILQAADSKWLGWNSALEEHGIRVEFLCPEDLERFRQNKIKA